MFCKRKEQLKTSEGKTWSQGTVSFQASGQWKSRDFTRWSHMKGIVGYWIGKLVISVSKRNPANSCEKVEKTLSFCDLFIFKRQCKLCFTRRVWMDGDSADPWVVLSKRCWGACLIHHQYKSVLFCLFISEYQDMPTNQQILNKQYHEQTSQAGSTLKVGGKEFPNVISDPQSSKEILSQENNLEN